MRSSNVARSDDGGEGATAQIHHVRLQPAVPFDPGADSSGIGLHQVPSARRTCNAVTGVVIHPRGMETQHRFWGSANAVGWHQTEDHGARRQAGPVDDYGFPRIAHLLKTGGVLLILPPLSSLRTTIAEAEVTV